MTTYPAFKTAKTALRFIALAALSILLTGCYVKTEPVSHVSVMPWQDGKPRAKHGHCRRKAPRNFPRGWPNTAGAGCRYKAPFCPHLPSPSAITMAVSRTLICWGNY